MAQQGSVDRYHRAVLCCFIALLTSCERHHDQAASKTEVVVNSAPRADSAAERKRLVQEIVKLQPTAAFLDDLKGRIGSIAGREVGAEVERRLLDTFGAQALEAQRVGLLEAHFTAEELQELLRLHESPAGRSLLRKFPAYEEGWKSFLSPIIIAELSGQAERR